MNATPNQPPETARRASILPVPIYWRWAVGLSVFGTIGGFIGLYKFVDSQTNGKRAEEWIGAPAYLLFWTGLAAAAIGLTWFFFLVGVTVWRALTRRPRDSP